MMLIFGNNLRAQVTWGAHYFRAGVKQRVFALPSRPRAFLAEIKPRLFSAPPKQRVYAVPPKSCAPEDVPQ